jgi:hypothetical protein
LPYYSFASYYWTGPNGFSSNSNNPIVPFCSEINAGIYTVTATVPGCGAPVYVPLVVVNRAPVLSATSNSPVCAGSPIYLNATAPTPIGTVVWTGPNGYSSLGSSPGILNATTFMSGVYSVASNVPGCGSTFATTHVQVNQDIQTVSTWSNSPLCVGQTLRLSATVASGATYFWRGPDGFTANTSQVFRNNVNSSMSGIYTLSVSQGGCGGTRELTRSVSVSNVTAPTVTVQNSPACVGNIVYLNSTIVSGATSYQWTGPNGYLFNGRTASIGNVQLNQSGVYTLNVGHSGCGGLSSTVSLSVNPLITSYNILSSSPGCVGSTLTLSSTVPTGGNPTHLWVAPNGATFNTAGITISNAQVANAGVYTYTVTSQACGTNTRTFRYVINNPASVSATNNGPLCVGQLVYLNGAGPTGSTYNWSGPAGYVSNVQFASRSNVQLSHAGVYTMSANVLGCGLVSRTTTLVVNTCREAIDNPTDGMSEDQYSEGVDTDGAIAENQAKLSLMKVHPNPFHDDLTLSWADDMRVFSVKLFDLNGKLLYEGEPVGEEVELSVRVADLPNGVYLLTVQTSAGPMSYRVTRL